MKAKTPSNNMSLDCAPVGAAWKRHGKSCLAFALVVAMTACNVSGLSSESSDAEDSAIATSTDAFPSELAIASPFSTTDSSEVSANLRMLSGSGAAPRALTYVESTESIEDILSGTSPADCTFDPEMFLIRSHDASCYGPVVAYEEHPEGSAGNSGELPPGDLGLWDETDNDTGMPCAAAELNARMEGVSAKSQASLMSLASLVCVINTEGYSMPSSSVLDLTTDMNNLAITGVTFTNASIGHQINADSNDEYTYNLRFEYDDGIEARDIEVDMEHIPSGSADVYTGHLSYLVNDTMTFGNCPDPETTHNGSLRYDRTASDAIAVEARDAEFCGADADGRVAGEEYVDAALQYPADPNGWGNNFSILTAEYDPSELTLDGNYSYVWQAGPWDSNTRVFNLVIEATSATTQTGAFYFGYGDEIAATDGTITGFICNWVAPGADHTVSDFAQYQEVEVDLTTLTFASVAANIGYAPTTTCEYDGSGSFIFDTDGDGDLTDESNVAVANDLLAASDVDGDGVATMVETIADTGFSVPVF